MEAQRLRERFGEWALVTGASSGIGRAFAYRLAQGGMNVVLVSNEAAELEQTADQLRQTRVEARVCCVDLAAPGFLDSVRAQTGDAAISLLVNNASFGSVGSFLSHPLDRYQSMIGVNVRAYVALTHHFLPAMLAANRGALIFVSSLNVISPIAKSAVYTATKAFEFYFAGALWWELRESPIDVLIVQPGPTKTGFQKTAGTKLASWAMEPAEVVDGALAVLGKQGFFIPGERNRKIAETAMAMPLEERIALTSRLLDETLIQGVEPSL